MALACKWALLLTRCPALVNRLMTSSSTTLMVILPQPIPMNEMSKQLTPPQQHFTHLEDDVLGACPL